MIIFQLIQSTSVISPSIGSIRRHVVFKDFLTWPNTSNIRTGGKSESAKYRICSRLENHTKNNKKKKKKLCILPLGERRCQSKSLSRRYPKLDGIGPGRQFPPIVHIINETCWIESVIENRNVVRLRSLGVRNESRKEKYKLQIKILKENVFFLIFKSFDELLVFFFF